MASLTIGRASETRVGAAARQPGAPATTAPRVTLWLTVIGGLLLPLGLTAIVLGWYGAAHTPFAFEQNSYLISGGLLGVGLVLTGGFLYFGAWIARLVSAQREDNDRLLAALERLAIGPAAGLGVAPASGTAAFVATPNGSMRHRPDCAIVAERSDLRQVSADEPGLRACRLCDSGEGGQPES